MPKIIKHILLTMFLLFSISACSGEDAAPEIVSQMEIITLQTTPSLEHWLADVADCAGDIPDFGIVTHTRPLADLDLDQADLLLRLGERQESDPFVAVMGVENTVILVGSEVPIDSLNLGSLQQIFAGELTNWSEVPEINEAGIEINQLIQTLSYPKDHEIRLLFQRAYLGGGPVSSNPLIFSTEEFLKELIETTPYSISYTLESLLPDNAQTLTINAFEKTQAQHAVLAVTKKEPTGKLRQLLLCIQN